MKDVLLRLAHALGSRRSFGLFLLAILLSIRIWDPHPLEELRLRSFDLYQNISPRKSSLRPVVIVDIDEERWSLDSLAPTRAIRVRSRSTPRPALPPWVLIRGPISSAFLTSSEISPNWNRALRDAGYSASAQKGMGSYVGCR